MTSSPIEISDWLDAKTLFHPRMTATVELSVADALDLVAAAFGAQGFKVKDSTAAGFRAVWWDRSGWFGVIANTAWDFKRTRVAVSAAATGSGTLLTVQVEKGAEHRVGRRQGREALTTAFQDAQRRGIEVTTTPWEKPQ